MTYKAYNIGRRSPNRTDRVRPETREMARRLRKNQTPSEEVLWQALRGKKIGVRIKRQAVVWGYIADFYCPAASLITELDGYFHKGREAQDATRDRNLER